MNMHLSRREFTQYAALSTVMMGLNQPPSIADEPKSLHISTNVYPWQTFYRRNGKDHNAQLDTLLSEVARSNLDGFEGFGGSPDEMDRLIRLVKKHGLEMRSLYVNSTLHEPAQVESSISNILKIADKAYTAGTRIIVTNPNPIRWGGPENKNDRQIRFQAQSLNRLGKKLKSNGMTLAYHFHDIELREAARELHHMMVGTDPDLVSLCFDAHWVYRGAGNSEVAMFDIAKLYAPRITELHIRQSQNGIWTETFGPGDINYPKLVDLLQEHGVQPHLVLEQAVEKASPNTMTAEAAHRKSTQYTRQIFAPLGT